MTGERDRRNRYDLPDGESRFQNHFMRDLTAIRPHPCTMVGRREGRSSWHERDRHDEKSRRSVARSHSTGNRDLGEPCPASSSRAPVPEHVRLHVSDMLNRCEWFRSKLRARSRNSTPCGGLLLRSVAACLSVEFKRRRADSRSVIRIAINDRALCINQLTGHVVTISGLYDQAL